MKCKDKKFIYSHAYGTKNGKAVAFYHRLELLREGAAPDLIKWQQCVCMVSSIRIFASVHLEVSSKYHLRHLSLRVI